MVYLTLPLGQVKIAAVTTPQDETVKPQNFLKVEITPKLVKVESHLCFWKNGTLLKMGGKVRRFLFQWG